MREEGAIRHDYPVIQRHGEQSAEDFFLED